MFRFGKLLIIIGMCLLTSCSFEQQEAPIFTGDITAPIQTIDSMQARVDVVADQVEELYNQDFAYLVNAYMELDSTVARKKDIHEEMDLLQAYLQQYETQRLVLKEKIQISRKQLSALKDDISNRLVTAEKQAKFIQDEEKEIRIMEHRIVYFQDRFDIQKEIVQKLKNK